jgi:hypothetical protein
MFVPFIDKVLGLLCFLTLPFYTIRNTASCGVWVTCSTLTSRSESNFAAGFNYIIMQVILLQPHQVASCGVWVTCSTLTSRSESNFAAGFNYIIMQIILLQPHQVDCLRVFFFGLEHFYFSWTLKIGQKVIQNICIVMLQFITPAVIFSKVKYDKMSVSL